LKYVSVNRNDMHVITHCLPCLFALSICHPTVICVQHMDLD
jgi:hypothetical protein